MTRATLRYLHSPDAPDLEHYSPQDPEHFSILVQALIGPEDQPGEEAFDFLVCTSRWLSSQLSKERYMMGKNYLFLSRYDYALLQEAIQKICSQAEGKDWEAVTTYLGRYGKWEFEDYKAKND